MIGDSVERRKYRTKAALWSSFFAGILMTVATRSMRQDLMGLEKSVEHLRYSWMNTHWAMWLVLGAIAAGWHIVTVREVWRL